MLEKLGIHTNHFVGGTRKDIHNTKTRIQNRLYLTMIFIAKNWDENKNSHKNLPRDTENKMLDWDILSITDSRLPLWPF